MRIVRVYDASRRPRDWMDLIQPGQFVVFPSLLEEGTPVDANGAPTSHEAATCVICDSLDEAEAFSRDSVDRHPAVRFDVFDAAGRSRPPLLTVVHPSQVRKLEGDATGRRRNVILATALIVAALGLIVLDWREGGVLMYLPTLLALNMLIFAGRLLQLNAAYASAERRSRERLAGRHQRG